MKKQVKLTARETSATNRDFYNLFRPIAPISLLATILVVAILELGGRKFLQVLTRALVWKRLKNRWYVLLFGIVTLITIGMGVLSFRLSTNGIQHAFVSKVPVTVDIDDSKIKSDYRQDAAIITAEFDKEWKLIRENHSDVVESIAENYDAQIAALTLKEKSFERKYKQGAKWAKSHADKYGKKASSLFSKKTKAIAVQKSEQTELLNDWRVRKNDALAVERDEMKSSIAAITAKQSKVNSSRLKKATFWGALFSYLVGFSVILAFICIVTVEVYRRGSGIQVEYDEEEKDQGIIEMIWNGISMRWNNFFRSRAERFAKLPSTTSNSRSIGFQNYPRPTMGNSGSKIDNEYDS